VKHDPAAAVIGCRADRGPSFHVKLEAADDD
jgi:hypothetical protein